MTAVPAGDSWGVLKEAVGLRHCRKDSRLDWRWGMQGSPFLTSALTYLKLNGGSSAQRPFAHTISSHPMLVFTWKRIPLANLGSVGGFLKLLVYIRMHAETLDSDLTQKELESSPNFLLFAASTNMKEIASTIKVKNSYDSPGHLRHTS